MNNGLLIKKVAIVGSGHWGMTFARLLAHNSELKARVDQKYYFQIDVYCRNKYKCNKFEDTRIYNGFAYPIEFPKCVHFHNDLSTVINNADLIAIAVPGEVLNDALSIIPYSEIKSSATIITLVKSLIWDEKKRLLIRPSQLIEEKLCIDKSRIAALSGPTIASEIAYNFFVLSKEQRKSFFSYKYKRESTHAEIAGVDKEHLEQLMQFLEIPRMFQVYCNSDIVGVELCAGVKNILAVGAGLLSAATGITCDGANRCFQGFGSNILGSYLQLGLLDMAQFVHDNKGDVTTAFGISGIGDMITTCCCRDSRNRKWGQVKSLEAILSKIHDNTSVEYNQINTEMSRVIQELKDQIPEAQFILSNIHPIISSTSKNSKPENYPLLNTIHRTVFGNQPAIDAVDDFIDHLATRNIDFLGDRIRDIFREIFKRKFIRTRTYARNILTFFVSGIVSIACFWLYVFHRPDNEFHASVIFLMGFLGMFAFLTISLSKSLWKETIERFSKLIPIPKLLQENIEEK